MKSLVNINYLHPSHSFSILCSIVRFSLGFGVAGGVSVQFERGRRGEDYMIITIDSAHTLLCMKVLIMLFLLLLIKLIYFEY